MGPSYSRFHLDAKLQTNPNPKSNPNPNSHYNPNLNSISKMTTATAFSFQEKAVGPSYSRFNLYRRNLYRRNGNTEQERKRKHETEKKKEEEREREKERERERETDKLTHIHDMFNNKLVKQGSI